MGRAPCCDKTKVKRGPWSPEEDTTLKNYIHRHGTGGNWIALPHKAGLQRCGKSCRLRWLNYLRPDIKHGGFTEEEDNIILTLYNNIGSRWSVIASQLQGRTDNDVKNYWNTKLKKKLLAAANATTDVANSTTSTTNSVHLIGHSPHTHCNYYGNSASSGGGSGTQPYCPPCVEGQQNASGPIQLPLPSLMEARDQFGTSGSYGRFYHGSTHVSHQQVSNSFCLGNDDQIMVRPGSGGGKHGGLLIDDLLDGFDFQEKVLNEVCPTSADYSFTHEVQQGRGDV